MAQGRTERDGHHRERAVKTKCAHHWEIAPASGKVSPGKCKLCGKKRTFKNSLEQPDRPHIRLNLRDWNGKTPDN